MTTQSHAPAPAQAAAVAAAEVAAARARAAVAVSRANTPWALAAAVAAPAAVFVPPLPDEPPAARPLISSHSFRMPSHVAPPAAAGASGGAGAPSPTVARLSQAPGGGGCCGVNTAHFQPYTFPSGMPHLGMQPTVPPTSHTTREACLHATNAVAAAKAAIAKAAATACANAATACANAAAVATAQSEIVSITAPHEDGSRASMGLPLVPPSLANGVGTGTGAAGGAASAASAVSAISPPTSAISVISPPTAAAVMRTAAAANAARTSERVVGIRTSLSGTIGYAGAHLTSGSRWTATSGPSPGRTRRGRRTPAGGRYSTATCR